MVERDLPFDRFEYFQQEIRKVVTDIIQNEFAKLKIKCEELHRKHLASD